MSWPEYEVSQRALEDGKRLGLDGGVERQIADMARSAAIVTCPDANRLHENFASKHRFCACCSSSRSGRAVPEHDRGSAEVTRQYGDKGRSA